MHCQRNLAREVSKKGDKELGVEVVHAIRDSFAVVVNAVFSNTYAWIFLTVVISIFLFRAEPRNLTAESVVLVFGSAKEFVESSLWGIVGWMLAAVQIAVGAPLIYVQHRRLKAQGETTYASKGGPNRQSAGSKNVLDRDRDSLKKRFPVQKDD